MILMVKIHTIRCLKSIYKFFIVFVLFCLPFLLFFLDDHLSLSDSFMFEWLLSPVFSFPVQNWVSQWHFSYLISKKILGTLQMQSSSYWLSKAREGSTSKNWRTTQSYDQELCCADLNCNQQWIKVLAYHVFVSI